MFIDILSGRNIASLFDKSFLKNAKLRFFYWKNEISNHIFLKTIFLVDFSTKNWYYNFVDFTTRL